MKLNSILPILYAAALFTVIRVANDIPIDSNYLSHSPLFIAIELTGLIVGCYVSFFFFRKLIRYSVVHCVPPLIEYACVAVFPLLLALLVIFLSHGGDVGLLRDVVIPVVVVSLMSLWLYSGMKSGFLARSVDEQRLKNEIMRNEYMQAELQLLRAQYHPHFLFNMLNAIYFTIDEDNVKARETVEHLANLLRGQLYTGDEKIKIRREVEAMKSYVALQKVRFGDSISVYMDIDSSLGEEMIYPHLFMPLIENAFKHCGGDSFVSFTLSREPAGIVFRVVNSTGEIKGNSDGGKGLDNLRRRLELLYPGDCHRFVAVPNGKIFTAELMLRL